MTPSADQKAHARHVFRTLTKLYPDAHCALHHGSPLQLLIATILSAQCTDARVNMVTPALFARYPTAKAFADADLDELESYIQSTGFFRAKAKNIQACCRKLVEQFGGEVPDTLEELVTVARRRPKDGERRSRRLLRRAGHHRGHARRPSEPPAWA